jgi:hypothetical protein
MCPGRLGVGNLGRSIGFESTTGCGMLKNVALIFFLISSFCMCTLSEVGVLKMVVSICCVWKLQCDET